MRKIDLTGKRFGNLVVIAEADDYVSPKGYKKKMWTCICDCGLETIVMGSHLKSGHTISCGCQQLNKLKPRVATSLVGQKFGMLTVLERKPNRQVGKNSRVVWSCLCDCGNKTDVLSMLLKQGSIKSCGCLSMSHAERIMINYLTDHNFKFVREFKCLELTGIDGGVLSFDFVILDDENNIIKFIELDGEQHYKPVDYFGGLEKFNKVVINDNIKNKWCLDNGYELLRINISKCTTDKSFINLYDFHLLN